MTSTEQDWPAAGRGTQLRVLAGRVLRSSWGNPRTAVLTAAQPVVLLLLFSQVFAGVAALPAVARYGSYVNFLVPATMVNMAVTSAIASGGGLLAEIWNGVFARLRVLPVPITAVLGGRMLADLVALAAQMAVMLLVAVVGLGFRPSTAPLEMLGAYGLCLLLCAGLSWPFVALSAWARDPQTLQAVGFVVIFPLMFSSSAYMPLDTMPGWLRAVAVVNPLSHGIDAVRSLMLGGPVAGPVLLTVALLAVPALGSLAVAARLLERL